MQNNTMPFFTKTCFLSYGIMSRNKNIYGITAVDSLLHFLTCCDNDNYSWLSLKNVCYRSGNDLVKDWINYYLYNDKTMPLFYRHINNIYIDNPNFLALICFQTQYKQNPADKYILAIEDHNINLNTIPALNSIADIVHSWNPKSEFIVFSQINLNSDKFKNVILPLKHCRWKENEDYTVDETTFKTLSEAIQCKLNEKFFLDKSKKPEFYTKQSS